MRVFTIISGFEITDTMRHFVSSGYQTPQQIIADLDMAKALVLKSMNSQSSLSSKVSEKFNIDGFLDSLNEARKKEESSGNS